MGKFMDRVRGKINAIRAEASGDEIKGEVKGGFPDVKTDVKTDVKGDAKADVRADVKRSLRDNEARRQAESPPHR